jgi:hypothetical protein
MAHQAQHTKGEHPFQRGTSPLGDGGLESHPSMGVAAS